MRKVLFCNYMIMILFIISCKSPSIECENEFVKAKKNYIEYFKNYNEKIAVQTLNQINKSLECDDKVEEKLKIKLSLLLFLKKFNEAKQIFNDYESFSKYNYFENKNIAIEYVSLIECFDKRDYNCVKHKVEFLIKELEKNKKKDNRFYMTYYEIKSYQYNKDILKREIIEKVNLSNDEKQLLSDFVEYNENPLGPNAVDGPFSK